MLLVKFPLRETSRFCLFEERWCAGAEGCPGLNEGIARSRVDDAKGWGGIRLHRIWNKFLYAQGWEGAGLIYYLGNKCTAKV